jgi:hypothetical protein
MLVVVLTARRRGIREILDNRLFESYGRTDRHAVPGREERVLVACWRLDPRPLGCSGAMTATEMG